MAEKPLDKSGEVRSRQILFPVELDNYLAEQKELTGVPVVEQVRRAVLREANRLPVLGRIPCGEPREVFEDMVEERVVVGDSLRTLPGDFLLRAYGDSMVGDGIESGDLVLIRPQQTCNPNEIAAVMVNSPMGWQSTLKRVQFELGSNMVTLCPMNPRYEPIIIEATEDTLRICGVYRGLIRRY